MLKLLPKFPGSVSTKDKRWKYGLELPGEPAATKAGIPAQELSGLS